MNLNDPAISHLAVARAALQPVMEKRPQDRYSSAQALLDDLELRALG